jgi:hypothetical protein
MAHHLKTLAAVMAGVLYIQQASAELYISPVLRDAVETQPGVPSGDAGYAPQGQPGQRVVRPWVNPNANANLAPLSTSAIAQYRPASGLFGRDVPLKAAIEMLVPGSKSWTVVYEPGIEKKKVSWRDVSDWKEALGQISKQNTIIIGVNETAKRIAVTYTEDMAKQLAQPGTNIWVLQQGMSLRDNFLAWAKIAGWSVEWPETLADYPIDRSTTLVGQFYGKGGVVDRVLAATAQREIPLAGNFYKNNHTVVISNAGYTPGKPARPEDEGE